MAATDASAIIATGAGPTTLDGCLRHWARSTPFGPALAAGPELLTYAELDRRVDAAATLLRDSGVDRGDRVVLLGHNTVGWVIAFLAGLRTGAVVSPTNNRLDPAGFRDQCELLDAALVLHDDDHAALAASVAAERTTLALGRLASGSPRATRGAPTAGPAPDDAAVVSFTSGTTGAPKGAVLTHGALHGASAALVDVLATSGTDSTLVLVPLFHNTGFVDQLGQMLVVGGCTRLLRRYRTVDAVAELSARPVSVLVSVPSILRMLMLSDAADAVFGQVRVAMFGGSPMPAAWSEELLARWPRVRLVHGYGLTEFTSVCTLLPPDLVACHAESVGPPVPGVRLQVVGDDDRPVPPGETGEVWVSGPMRMREYWRRPDATAEKLRGEWLRTGDLGRLDDAGHLWLSGRVDDVINRGGEKILPAHVESCLADLDAVAEAAVVGVPDGVLQYRVGAAVQLRAGHSFDEDAIRGRLAERLPDYAVPDRWIVLEAFPRTGSGKADRRAIAGMLAQEPLKAQVRR